MGGEVIIYVAAALGFGLLVFLVVRIANPSARPYALPTLLFAAGGGLYEAWGSVPINWPFLFLAGFFVGGIIFGAHAHVVRWLRETRA